MIKNNCILILFIIILLPSLTHAETIEINFSGLVSGKDDLGIFGSNNATYSSVIASGSIRYNTDIAPLDSDPHNSFGRYLSNGSNDWMEMVFSFNGITISGFDQEIEVSQGAFIHDSDEPAVTSDTINFSEHSNNGAVFNDPLTEFYRSMDFLFYLYDDTGNLVDNDSLPLSSTNIGQFNDFFIEVGFTEISPDGSMTGRAIHTYLSFDTLDSISFSSSPVPEPATMLLFGLGLLGLAGVNRKKK